MIFRRALKLLMWWFFRCRRSLAVSLILSFPWPPWASVRWPVPRAALTAADSALAELAAASSAKILQGILQSMPTLTMPCGLALPWPGR